MTHVNSTVPRLSEIYAWKNRELEKAESIFWKARAEEYAAEIENIFAHAKDTGHVEIWRGSEKINLYTKPDEGEAA